MSAIENSQTVWASISNESLDSKYEKCRNITEEIYKRINITFQIKKLETASQSDESDHSDQIDSNELSNETDLFACDKSSISSSTEPENPATKTSTDKYININNNEETNLKKAVVVYKRPRKRFRKRVKKRQTKPAHSDTDGSSDEALPLSRVVELDTKCVDSEECAKSGSPDKVMGVPKIIIRDIKPKLQSPEKRPIKKESPQRKFDNKNSEKPKPETVKKETQNNVELPVNCNKNDVTTIDKAAAMLDVSVGRVEEKNTSLELKNCTMCSLSFRGERGLRRHLTMSHIISPEEAKLSIKTEQRDVKPA